MANSKNKNQNRESNQSTEDYNTPLNPEQRHTGAYIKDNSKEGAEPESGSNRTEVEGAPNQGTEKR